MDSSSERAVNIISSAINLSTQVKRTRMNRNGLSLQALSSSEDPNVVKCSSQLLATIVSSVFSKGHELGRRVLEQKIVHIVQVFKQIKIDS